MDSIAPNCLLRLGGCLESRVSAQVKSAIERNDHQAFKKLLASYSSYIVKDLPAILKTVVQNKQREFLLLLADFNLLSTVKSSTSKNEESEKWFPLLDAIVRVDIDWIQLLHKYAKVIGDKSNIPLIIYTLKWGLLKVYESRHNPEKKYNSTESDLKILETLIQLGENINEIYENETPITFAARVGMWHCVKLLLKYGAKIDCFCRGITAREVIQFKQPELLENVAKPDIKYEMLLALKLKDEAKFIELLEMNQHMSNGENEQGFTFLQLAIHNKMSRAVDALLSSGANPNQANIAAKFNKTKYFTRSSPPIIMAMTSGQRDIFISLLYHKDTNLSLTYGGNNTIYHLLARDWKYVTDKSIKDSSLIFLNDFFKRAYTFGVDILQKNDKGNTALYLACKCKRIELLNLFFQYGAFSNISKCELQKIPAEFINVYFDKCVKIGSAKECIQIDYSFIDISQVCKENGESDEKLTKPVSIITTAGSYDSVNLDDNGSISEGSVTNIGIFSEMHLFHMLSLSKNHEHLLKHPIVRIFLYLKWRKVFPFYFVNFLLFFTFTVFLSLYVFSSKYNYVNMADNIGYQWILTLIFWSIISLREILQFYISKLEYFQSLENCLELILLTTSGYLLIFGPQREVASVSIIASYTEMSLLIGRNPYISTYVTIFTQVSKKSLSLLIIFSPSIIAFAFGFFITFRETGENDNFNSVGISVFKTIMMLSGELEMDKLNFEISSLLSRVLFVLFLVFIVIVFSNVLNALAISDTQAIVEKAELLNCIEEVRLYSKLELIWIKYISSKYDYINEIILDFKYYFPMNVCPLALYYCTGSHYHLLTNENIEPYHLRLVNKYIFGFDNVTMGKKVLEIYETIKKKGLENIILETQQSKSSENIMVQNILASERKIMDERLKILEDKLDETSNTVSALVGDIQEIKLMLLSMQNKTEN